MDSRVGITRTTSLAGRCPQTRRQSRGPVISFVPVLCPAPSVAAPSSRDAFRAGVDSIAEPARRSKLRALASERWHRFLFCPPAPPQALPSHAALRPHCKARSLWRDRGPGGTVSIVGRQRRDHLRGFVESPACAFAARG